MKKIIIILSILLILTIACKESSTENLDSIVTIHETGLYSNPYASGEYLKSLPEGTKLEPANNPLRCEIYNADGGSDIEMCFFRISNKLETGWVIKKWTSIAE
jgi:hypothetical protein